MRKKIGKAAKWAGIFLLCLAAAAFLMEAASPETEEAGSSTEETHVENVDAGTSNGSTVNASFYVFPNFKFSDILDLANDNLHTFVYNYFQNLERK